MTDTMLTNDIFPSNEVEFVSVCVISHDADGQPWINRIADISNDQIIPPQKSNRPTRYFENRDSLYYKEGPTELGSIGVWFWRAEPHQSHPQTDYVHSYYQQNMRPTRVVQNDNIKSKEALITALKEGTIFTRPYICDTLFCYEKAWNEWEGVLCRSNEFTIENEAVKLNDTVYSLPCFSFQSFNIYNCNNVFDGSTNLLLMRSLDLGEPTEFIIISNIDNLIKTIILDRISWKFYNNCIGRTKAEWRESKKLLETVCSSDDIYKELTVKLNCSIEQAHESIDLFINKADSLFQQGDIDADIIAKIAMSNDALRTQCEDVIEQHWNESHTDMIAVTQKELDKKKQDLSEKKLEYDILLADISTMQKKRDALLKEIEVSKTLGEETAQAIQDKINAAQQNMAGFIADLSAFMPQQSVQKGTICETKPANRWTFIEGSVCKDAEYTEECTSWQETHELLRDNLELAGVGSDWSGILASFLFSAYLNRMSLLLAGPNAEAIANALSMTIYGKRIDILNCSGEQDVDSIVAFTQSKMAAVKNPFHPDWITRVSNEDSVFSLWLHPFIEDLQIEPRSLYHYVYPVFTESFVDKLPSIEGMDAGKKALEYEELKTNSKYRARTKRFTNLGLSRFISMRLYQVLSDAKQMSAMDNSSMEYLFGLLPLCVLSDKQEILTEILDRETNLKPQIREELKRHVEE